MKISIERDKCIGCGTCTNLCPKYFELKDDGKSFIIGSNNDELEITNIECAKEAAENCPVQCIHII